MTHYDIKINTIKINYSEDPETDFQSHGMVW